MRKFFRQAQVFLRQAGRKVLDDPAVERAGRAASRKDTAYVEKKHSRFHFRRDGYAQTRARHTSKRLRKYFARRNFRDNIPVAPEILLDDTNAALQKQHDTACFFIPRAQDVFILLIHRPVLR